MAAIRRSEDQHWRPSAATEAAQADQSIEKHLVIAGTGRAGTSFLVRYLTELGLDTTLARNGDQAGWDNEANAGLENLLIPGADLPYVVKSPWISEYIDQILDEKKFKIDAFIVPVRDLVEAATSRAVLEQRAIHQHNPWMAERLTKPWGTYGGHSAGGLVYSLNPLDQARLLAVQFHRLVLKVAEAGIPLVFPVFPRIATDWRYLYQCLKPILPTDITERLARAAHARVADAAKVRVTSEIVKDSGGNVRLNRSSPPEPQYPSLTEVDNIALRREIGRLRLELRQQVAAQESSTQTADQLRGQLDQLSGQISELQAAKLEYGHDRAGFEATIQGLRKEGADREATIQALRQKLEAKSIKRRMVRLLRFSPAVSV